MYNNSDTYLFSKQCYKSSPLSPYDDNGCTSSLLNNTQCSSKHDMNINGVSIWIIDFEKENNMKFGRTFNSKKHSPSFNEVIIYEPIANELNLTIGDIIYLSLPLNSIDVPLFQNYFKSLTNNKINDTFY